ncbi:hypothetical protein BS78_K029600 [Paspalum vaginatum]|uniref:Uncharacterized protein n=1 Tax=Paspalum vaginatum TaxID=158149 RepID=A0A9W8CCW1_9POAL|nr:hypothetical protein BS78_K029600 [Paspalum vaginatum]
MLARAFGLVAKACNRTPNTSVQASTSPHRLSDRSPVLRCLHSRLALPEIPPQELHLQQNNSGDTFQGSFDQRFATLKSIGEDRVNDHELKLLLKKKSAPICYVWCDPSPWMHISQV